MAMTASSVVDVAESLSYQLRDVVSTLHRIRVINGKSKDFCRDSEWDSKRRNPSSTSMRIGSTKSYSEGKQIP